jgi:hypothetical protein
LVSSLLVATALSPDPYFFRSRFFLDTGPAPGWDSPKEAPEGGLDHGPEDVQRGRVTPPEGGFYGLPTSNVRS